MSNTSRFMIGVVLLSLAAAPMQGQLRERTRLKPPLLRLPLGQRNNANPTPQAQPPQYPQAGVAQPVQPMPTEVAPGLPVAAPQLPVAAPQFGNPPNSVIPGTTQTPVPGVAGAPQPARPLTPSLTLPSTAENPSASVSPSAPLAGQAEPKVPLPGTQSLPAAVPPTATPPQGMSVAAIPVKPPHAQTKPAAPLAPPAQMGPRQTMDLALSDAKVALQHMRANVRDYTCSFVKRERVNGQLLPTETAQLKVRNRVVQNGALVSPLSVYMKFVGPRDVKGREVIFVEGQNNGKMICKEGGTKGRFLPSIWLKETSSFIMSTNRYPISQIGMVRLAERLISNGTESPMDGCNVKYVHGAKVDGRTCSYLEVIRPTPRPGLPVGHNNVNIAQVFIDTELQMPIRFVAYDWPAQTGGNPRLIEQYTYRDIKVNVGLTEGDFSHKNPNYKF